jgi:hypothetical protein
MTRNFRRLTFGEIAGIGYGLWSDERGRGGTLPGRNGRAGRGSFPRPRHHPSVTEGIARWWQAPAELLLSGRHLRIGGSHAPIPKNHYE